MSWWTLLFALIFVNLLAIQIDRYIQNLIAKRIYEKMKKERAEASQRAKYKKVGIK